MTEKCCNGCSCDKLGIVHCAVTGGVALGIIYLACWLGAAFTAMPVTHSLITFFTTAPMTSTTALAVGLCWSLIFGAWSGLVLALVSNFVSRFTRPS
ncbi:MAG: hypothetical protein ABL909_06720 [Sphingopyxis sp.]